MASSITIEAHRRRFNVKGGPMQPLSALVADVLGQLNLAGQLRPEDCQLLLRGKPLDLATPVRFANIGRDKLELRTGREQVLGVQEAPKPAAPAAAVTTAAMASEAAPPAPQLQPAAPAVPAVQAHPVAAPGPPQSAASASMPAAAAAPVQAAAAAPAAEPSTSAAAAPAVPAAAAAAAAAPPPPAAADVHPSVALFGRRVWVFTRQAEQQAEGAAGGPQEVDDLFYDFTEADLRRAMASQSAQRAKQEGGHLMTAAMREREERRRAESYGDVHIRLYLPDGATVLQTALPATAPLAELLALARAALAPGAAAGAYLFTTPPRTVLKDLSPSLYAAKLVPAAKVHVGVDAGKAAAAAPATMSSQGQQQQQHVRPEVLALAEAPPERAAVMHTRAAAQQQQPAGAAAGGSAAAGGAAGGSRASGAAQVQKGVPKWLKLGGK
ncbi:hypothetical protein ABPG75_008000 [Micractinium tetrahymenae]